MANQSAEGILFTIHLKSVLCQTKLLFLYSNQLGFSSKQLAVLSSFFTFYTLDLTFCSQSPEAYVCVCAYARARVLQLFHSSSLKAQLSCRPSRKRNKIDNQKPLQNEVKMQQHHTPFDRKHSEPVQTQPNTHTSAHRIAKGVRYQRKYPLFYCTRTGSKYLLRDFKFFIGHRPRQQCVLKSWE